MHHTTVQDDAVSSLPTAEARRRHGALGKAIIVWLVSGSALAGIAAYFLFGAMGC